MIAAWLLLLTPAVAPPALERAVRCYEQLDYPCAEERLAEALAGPLTPPQIVQARHYQALLAVAWRDEGRARRAVQAIFAVDPHYQPGEVPPQLARLFVQERPEPPPAPRPLARLDATTTMLFAGDAERWSEGLGVAAGTTLLLDERWRIELGAAFSDHRPLDGLDEGLAMWTGDVGLGLRLPVGPVQIHTGFALGFGYIAVDAVLRDSTYWGGRVALPVEVVWPLWHGLGVGLRVEPSWFFTPNDDALASSFLLPLGLGLRYDAP
jgi:hypothetical protein